MLQAANLGEHDTVIVHGASGAVGVSVLQQARLMGINVIGTASERNFDVVRQFGGTPVVYGDGLLDRLREVAPSGYDASLDTVGSDEAIDVSLQLIKDPSQIVSIAGFGRAGNGITLLGGWRSEESGFP